MSHKSCPSGHLPTLNVECMWKLSVAAELSISDLSLIFLSHTLITPINLSNYSLIGNMPASSLSLLLLSQKNLAEDPFHLPLAHNTHPHLSAPASPESHQTYLASYLH